MVSKPISFPHASSSRIAMFQLLGYIEVTFPQNNIVLIRSSLVDGISVMETGYELSYPSPTYEPSRRDRRNWDPIIHFDMKPGNSE